MVKIRIFNALKLFSSAEDKFCGRTTRGANDAVNSALNYGYAILTAEPKKRRLGGYVSWKKRSVRMDDIIEEQAYLLARHVKGEAKYNAFIGKY